MQQQQATEQKAAATSSSAYTRNCKRAQQLTSRWLAHQKPRSRVCKSLERQVLLLHNIRMRQYPPSWAHSCALLKWEAG